MDETNELNEAQQRELMINTNKRNLIAKLMRDEFEKNSRELLKTAGSLDEIDIALTPMVEQYFKELEALYEYYKAKGVMEAM